MKALGILHDAVPPDGEADVRATVEEDLGRPLEEVFEAFDFKAVAKALAVRAAQEGQLLGGGAAPDAEGCRLRFAALNTAKGKKKSSPKAVTAVPAVPSPSDAQAKLMVRMKTAAAPPAPPSHTNFSGLD